jgi:hypothetical protein
MLSTSTVLLEVTTADGAAAWRDPWAGPGYRSFQATPPHAFGDWQPGHIPVSIDHGGPVIGAVDYLEAGLGHGNGGLFAVAVVEGVPADLIDGLVYCSPEIRANAIAVSVGRGRSTTCVGELDATRAIVDAVALVDVTAGVGATKAQAWPGDYRCSIDRGRWGRDVPAILRRAIDVVGWDYRTRRRHRTQVHRPALAELELRSSDVELSRSAPYPGVLRVRSA